MSYWHRRMIDGMRFALLVFQTTQNGKKSHGNRCVATGSVITFAEVTRYFDKTCRRERHSMQHK